MDDQLRNDISVEELCQMLSEASGYTFGDIYNMEIKDVDKLVKKHFNKHIKITLK